MIAALLLACGPAPDPGPAPRPSPPARPPLGRPLPTSALTDGERFGRLSLDLRGVRPSLAELDAFEADPEGTWDGFVEDFLQDPRFGARVADLWSEVYTTRTAPFFVYFDWLVLDSGYSEDTLAGHVAEEPLRVLARLADEDLPYDQLVLADWTMSDEVTASVYPVDYPAGATGWRPVRYTDDRPRVGILSSNGWWWHKGSMENNRNRGRANEVARDLLCDDYLERLVPFFDAGDLVSEEDQADALTTNPACVACHESLDPLASHFYGFWWYTNEKVVPELISEYRVEREDLWRELTGVPPGYFGAPSRGLVDLGSRVAADPRFARCFVDRSWELVTRTDLDLDPVELGPVHAAFGDGLRVRDAFRALVALPAYQGWDDRFARRRMTPELLSDAVEDLTGYRWTAPDSGRDLTTAQTGYVLLAGGFDRERVANPAPTETVTTALVEKRLAENAAEWVVLADRALPPGERRLLSRIDFGERPDGAGRDRMVLQLRELHRRTQGRDPGPDAAELDEELELWSRAEAATGDPTTAWTTVVSVLLRDPAFLTY